MRWNGLLITTVVLIILSFDSIEPNEVGILTHDFFGYVLDDQNLYQAGYHWVWLWGQFTLVDKTTQNEVYLVNANTRNIIAISAEISIQFVIKQNFADVYEVIYKHEDFKLYFDTVVTEAIRLGIQSVDSDILYSDRGLVTDKIRTLVAAAIEKTGYMLVNLQVTDLEVPGEIQNAVDRLVFATQDVAIATNERNAVVNAAENAQRQAIHAANIAAASLQEKATAKYEADVRLFDARLYAKQQTIKATELLADAYASKFPGASDKQKMELLKAQQYMQAIETLSGSSAINQTQKIFIDHKPNAIGKMTDGLKSRFT